MAKTINVQVALSEADAEGKQQEYAQVRFASENGCRLTVTGDGLTPSDLEVIQQLVKAISVRSSVFPNLQKITQAKSKSKFPEDEDEEFDDDDN